MELRRITMNKQGFTLVELIVVMVLFGLIITMGYYVYGVVTNYYRITSDRTNAQENFRLVSDYLSKEFGNAEYITLLPDVTSIPDDPVEGGMKVYVDSVSPTEDAVFVSSYSESTSSFEDETMIGYPVKTMDMVFYAMNNNTEILGMEYSAKEFDTADKFLVENILLQNSPLQDIVLASRYDAVYFTSY